MMLCLQRYDIKLVYKKGKERYVADTLSRAYIDDDDTVLKEDEYEVMSIAPVRTVRANQLKERTEHDEITQRLMKVITNGWQRNKTNVHGDIQVYFDVRDELTV
jgi:hypothetical protein